MDQTERLLLPLIMPGQAQKHITHNEAIAALDALVQPVVESRVVATPLANPLPGSAFVVPSGATGAWAGRDNAIAAFQSGAWRFYEPAPGWQVYVASEQAQLVFDGTDWVVSGSNLEHLGINASADETSRFAVASAATLFSHDGHGHQLKINKAGTDDTASLLYQIAWSGRAEMGLMGDDQWRLKVSPDGSGWIDALTVNATTAVASFAGSVRPAVDNAVSLGASGARWSTIWSATGTIQTSDERQKTDIELCDLGLDFILELLPVKYRWRVGENGADGPRAGRRLHYGLLAQQVHEALDGRDFGGHVLADPDDPDSAQGLRYDAFIAPLILAIHDLSARIDGLKLRSSGRGRAP